MAAMPGSLTLVDALRGDGVPAVVSGGGPTVLAFVADGVPELPSADDVLGHCPEGWTSHLLGVDRVGVQRL